MRSTTPAGWYPDWDDPDLRRYWDGTQWTDQVEPHPQGAPLTQSHRPPDALGSTRTVWLAVGAVVLLVGGIAIGAAAAGGDDDPAPTSASATATVTVTASPEGSPSADGDTVPSLRFPKQAGDWQLEALEVTSDDGNFIAGGDLTYLGDEEPSGDQDFTVTLFNNAGDVVATLSGSVTEVEPGQTVTTDLSGTDPYKPGRFPSTFQLAD